MAATAHSGAGRPWPELPISLLTLMVDEGIAPAGYYEAYYSERDWAFYAPLLSRIVKWSSSGPILDVGAGCGFLVEAALRRGLRCTGFDGSAEAIALARVRCPGIRMCQAHLSEGLPFADGAFDTVVINQVIEHLDQATGEQTIAEAHRVLRPQGMVMVCSPSRLNHAEARADPTHIHLYLPSELAALLRSNGFERLESFDSPLPLLGSGRLGRRAMRVAFKLLRAERLSATANCIAFKPARGTPQRPQR